MGGNDLKRIMTIFSARPVAIQQVPVIKKLEKRKDHFGSIVLAVGP